MKRSVIVWLATLLLSATTAQAGIAIQHSDAQGWNVATGGATSLYSSVSANAGDVVVLSVAGNKKNSIALVQGGWTGGTNGALTDLETGGDNYPASYISYIEVDQTGTYDFWMESGDANYTAISALYVLRSDGEPIALADTAEWTDNTTGPEPGTDFSLGYSFSSNLTDGVLVETISTRTDLISPPGAYMVDFTGSDKRMALSYDGVTGNSWTSDYVISGGDANKQSSSGLGVVFAAGSDDGGGGGPSVPEQLLEKWTYDGVSDGLLSTALSETGTGSAFGGTKTFLTVGNDVAYITSEETANEGYFGPVTDAGYLGKTSGVYEISYDVVSASFANTAAGSGQFGWGLRSKVDGNVDANVLFQYKNHTFNLVPKDANGTLATVTIASGTTTLSNVHIRQRFDFDNRGTLGSYQIFYTVDGAEEVELHPGLMKLKSDHQIDEFRCQIQTINGGNSWKIGDVTVFDNLILKIPASGVADPVLENPTNIVTNVTGGENTVIGETNAIQIIIENSGGSTASNTVATLTPASNPEYFTITTAAVPADLSAGEQTTNLFSIVVRTNALPGTYTFDIGITADGGFSISNRLDLTVNPGISVTGQDAQNAFSLVANTTNQVVTNLSMVVSNNTFAPLNCTFTDGALWLQNVAPLTIDPRSVSNIALIADSTGLALGTYTTALSVDYSLPVSSDFTDFTVRFDIGAKITFLGHAVTNEINNGSWPGIYEPNDIIDIVVSNLNEGGVSVSNIVNALSADPNFTIVPLTATGYPLLVSGAATTTAYRVTIGPNTPEGTHTFDVTNTGVYDGQTFVWPGSFEIEVVSHATPSVSPLVVNLPVAEGQTATASVTVSNTGNAAFTFTVTDDAVWDVSYGATPGSQSFISASTAIILNDPHPEQQFSTAETEGISESMPIGFSFPFYGTAYTRFYVTADGAIGLSNTTDTPELGDGYGSLPDGGGVPLIAPFWGSLRSPAGSVRYSVNSHYLLISYVGVDQASTYGGTDFDFQALLYRDGRIEFRYGEINGNWLDDVIVGIQSSGSVYNNVDITPASGTSVLLSSSENIWVSYAPTQRTVNPFSSVLVTFTADATTRTTGDSNRFNARFDWSSGGSETVQVNASVLDSVPEYSAVSSLAFSGPAGRITTVPFIITNTGTASLDFFISDATAAEAGVVGVDAPYNWIDISSAGTDVTLLDPDPNPYITAPDEGTSAQMPIGFTLPFFGGTYTHFAVSANGVIRLDGGTGRVRAVTSLDSAGASVPNHIIAPYWGDLVVDDGATLKVHSTADRLVVTWENVQQYGLQGGSNLTFQAILKPSGEIIFQYQHLEGYPWPHTPIGLRDIATRTAAADIRQPGDATIGTYTYSGQVYTQYVDTVSERTTAFEPALINVISASPGSGSISGGGTAQITITGDASNLSAGPNSAQVNATFSMAHNAAGSPDALAVTFTATNSQQTVFPVAAADDSDGDGQTDDDERIAGTDPQNSESVFVVKTTAGRELSWVTAAGRTYTVWYTTNLTQSFEILVENLSDGIYVDSVNSAEPVVYYKVTINNP